MSVREATLVLQDGTVFEGEAIGAEAGTMTGEIVFNTAMTGYQEVITDPSYAGKVIAFTYTHIGNCGTTPLDDQASKPTCRGVVIGELSRRRSNWRSQTDLGDFLEIHGISGVAGVDTRRLTRHIRENGSMGAAFGTAEEATLRALASEVNSANGSDLVASLTCSAPYTVDYVGGDEAPSHIIVYDFGVKRSLLARLARMARVEVVPASTPSAEVLAGKPDGVVLSNGPGDPMAIPWAIDIVKGLIGSLPVLGIGLGHQLAGLALGGATEKLHVGHHGANHPVRRVGTQVVDITAHHHSHVLNAESLEGIAEVTHIDLNDGSVEGIRNRAERVFGLQYHPEVGPGPRDAGHFLSEFVHAVSRNGV